MKPFPSASNLSKIIRLQYGRKRAEELVKSDVCVVSYLDKGGDPRQLRGMKENLEASVTPNWDKSSPTALTGTRALSHITKILIHCSIAQISPTALTGTRAMDCLIFAQERAVSGR